MQLSWRGARNHDTEIEHPAGRRGDVDGVGVGLERADDREPRAAGGVGEVERRRRHERPFRPGRGSPDRAAKRAGDRQQRRRDTRAASDGGRHVRCPANGRLGKGCLIGKDARTGGVELDDVGHFAEERGTGFGGPQNLIEAAIKRRVPEPVEQQILDRRGRAVRRTRCARRPAARSRPRSMTVCFFTKSTPAGSASAGAVAMLKAWPSTRCAAATSDAGRIVGALRQHDGVRRQRHAAFVDAGRQLDAAAGRGVAGERAESHLAGLLRDERELRGHRLPWRDGLEGHRLVREELRA